MSQPWPDDALLREAVEWMRQHQADGATCPCCGQFAKTYRRKLSSTMAYALVLMEQYFCRTGEAWLHVPSYLTKVVSDQHGAMLRGGDWAKLSYWGLIEERGDQRADGAKHAGWWRVTPGGRRFIHGQLRLPKHALVYNGRLLGLDDAETTSIEEALGDRFDYTELVSRMQPPPPPATGKAAQLSLLGED
jgi:hypothetical protein